MPLVRPGIRRLFRLRLFRRAVIAAEVDAEIDAHLALRVDQLIARGYAPDAARAEALRRFGNLEINHQALNGAAQHRETRMRISEWLDGVRQDTVYALRGLRNEPLLTTFVILTFALGIGANAAMFGVVDRLLLRGPGHIREQERVVRLYETVRLPGGREVNTGGFGYVMYTLMQKHATVLAGVAGYTSSQRQISFGEGTSAELINLGEATADFFPLLGVRPHLGRFFTLAEDSPTDPQRVVVLGYGIWKRAFGGDTGVVGKTAMISYTPYTVIGVAPKGFTGADMHRIDFWIPLSVRARNVAPNWTTTWNAQWHAVIARLKPGVTLREAGSDLTTAFHRAYDGGDTTEAKARMNVAPIRYGTDGAEPSEVGVTRWLIGVAAVMLLIGCANIVNLLLARAIRRRREVAVRVALGVGRTRLVRLLLTESFVLAAAGWIAGLGVAYGAGTLIRKVLLPSVEWPDSPVAGRVLVVSLLVTLIVGVVVGLLPAVQSAKADLVNALKAGAREGGGRMSHVRGALTIAQAALSVLLLIGAGLFVRSLHQIDTLDLGIQPNRVLTVGMSRPGLARIADTTARRLEQERRVNFLPLALERARGLPDVEAASLSVGLPFSFSFGQYARASGWDTIPTIGGSGPSVAAVAADYFKTVGQRLIKGRVFTAQDRKGSEPVSIVNATMAERLWPGVDPIGQCVFTERTREALRTAPCSRVVGVVADARRARLKETPRMTYYLPFGQEVGMGGTQLIVRPRGRPEPVAAALRREMQKMDPSITIVNVALLQEALDPQIRPWRLGATMFTLMGVLALVVAAVGLYSVMAYLVVQRTHEIGIRSALGANATDIVALVLKSGIALAAVGVALGIGAAFALGGFIAPLLFDTSPRDVLVFAVVGVSLLLVALLATAIPAMRARRVSPLQALRAE